MGIFDFLNNKKKEKARQEQLRLQKEKRRAEEQRRLAERRKQEDQQRRENRSCLISSLILPVISVMKMVNL